MPSNKTTKKSSSNRSSEEKNSKDFDIKPLSTYVDDRVELIRQAFTCLKPKTIKNVTPEFLKGKSIEKLQEICLDEVLGISKKRLLSIINDTKCPTDTESSSDSDAPKMIEDHISLSEISSDDNMFEDARNKKVKKVIKKEKKSDGKKLKNGEGSSKAGNRDEMSEKEVTVLELLELQARARAIRSQLALEPVTKIELDSDESASDLAVNKSKKDTTAQKPAVTTESSSKPKETISTKEASKERHSSGGEDRHKKKKRHKDALKPRSRSRNRSPAPEKLPDLRAKLEKRRTEIETSKNNSKPTTDTGRSTPSEEQNSRRRVVLKRNFSTTKKSASETSEQPAAETKSSKPESVTKEKTPEKEKQSEVIKKERNDSDRESSPDVIAMHPSPETILLTSSDEEKSPPSQKTKTISEVTKTPTKTHASKVSKKTPVTQKTTDKVLKSPIKAPEAETQASKDRSLETLSLEAEELDYDEKMSDSDAGPSQKKTPEKSKKQVNEKSTAGSGSESGADDWEDTIFETCESDKAGTSSQKTESSINQGPEKESPDSPEAEDRAAKTEIVHKESVQQDQIKNINNSEAAEATKHQEVVEVQSDISLSESACSSGSSDDSESEDNQIQSSEKINLDSSRNTSGGTRSDADVVYIDINESSDDASLNKKEQADQSWGQRWLRSRKVSNVMANAKFGNKIRGKIKEKKIEEKKAAEEKEMAEKLEREKFEEEERKRKEEENKAAEVPDEVLGSTKHFKDLKLLSLLKEERQVREAKQIARKKKQ